jgi:hypothetical protein
MKDSDLFTEALVNSIANLIIGLIMAAAVKYAFEFTWFQSFVITWLYCLLKDSVDTGVKTLKNK